MKYILSLWLLVIALSLHGQSARLHYNKSTKQAYLVHEVLGQQTLYGLSRTYGISVDDLMKANTMAKPNLSIGQRLIIPWQSSGYSYVHREGAIPVIYYAQKKDNLFRICRRYFDRSIAEVQAMNHMKDRSLVIGQRIIIGYMDGHQGTDLQDALPASIDKPAEVTTSTAHDGQDIKLVPTSATNSTATKEDETSIIALSPKKDADHTPLTIGYEAGAAHWDKHGSHLRGHYVLHRHAKPNTWIQLTNPMTKRSVSALVVGKLPENRYEEHILVVISPSIASDLEALDENFYVKVRYLQRLPSSIE